MSSKSINDIIKQRNRIYDALFYWERKWIVDEHHPNGHWKRIQHNPGPVWVKRWNHVWELAEAWTSRIGQSQEWKREFARVRKQPLLIVEDIRPELYEAEQERLAFASACNIKVDFYNK